MKKKNIIIFGSNGMLGKILVEYLSSLKIFNLICLNHKDIDISDFQKLNNVFSNYKNIDYVINCSAITDTEYCNTNEGMIESYKVNVQGTYNLGKNCIKNNIHFIHISTDAVYSEYMTNNLEFPVNVYGMHKLLAEKLLIHDIFKDNITKLSILRCSWIYGHTNNKKNFIDKVISWINNKDEINIVNDCFGRPTSCEFVSQFIYQCINLNQYGIIDCSIKSKPISRYEFSQKIWTILNKISDQQQYKNKKIIAVNSNYFKNLINQNKYIPEKITDEYLFYDKIINNINYSSDYDYWIEKYLKYE